MANDSKPSRPAWTSFLNRQKNSSTTTEGDSSPREEKKRDGPAKWSFGVLNDKQTIAVPGSVLLLASDHNEPLGLRNAPARTSHSSIPTGYLPEPPQEPVEPERKKTADGKINLDPQPEDSANDPLNWPTWRRDCALLSLGLYCMIGGGLTPLLAAGFTNVAHDYDVEVESVSLTTGLYMMGLGLGSVVASPTAILYGKRPVYLVSAILLIITSAWCAASPNFPSLILARIFQGISVSSVECLPSATIAEIFFLHERAYRIGIYTLLLLGGKNLVPLVSAAIVQSLGWRWSFWIVVFITCLTGTLLFFFVPESFWDRSPTPRHRKHHNGSRPSFFRRLSSKNVVPRAPVPPPAPEAAEHEEKTAAESAYFRQKGVHVGFVGEQEHEDTSNQDSRPREEHRVGFASVTDGVSHADSGASDNVAPGSSLSHSLPAGVTGDLESPEPHDAVSERNAGLDGLSERGAALAQDSAPATPRQSSVNFSARNLPQEIHDDQTSSSSYPAAYKPPRSAPAHSDTDSERQSIRGIGRNNYTHNLRDRPAQSFVQQLRPYHGRLNKDKWLKVAMRPFILFSYPSVLWSSAVYSCSIGWLIVISESVAVIYRDSDSYNFDALQTGLVYISPFIGGVLGTAVAGKVSDIIVKAMAKRNGGLYEPEFRLVMAAPITITTVIGLMGFGWSAEERDAWIVPTVFFGIVSFGCSLGSTTSITFCVDSYRQYAGEALVTLNFSKNIFHGLVFSLFVTGWLTSDGAKSVFIWIGVIQLIVLLFSIPMFIYGKRARMWTVRRNFMEKF